MTLQRQRPDLLFTWVKPWRRKGKKYSTVNKNVLWGNSLWVLCDGKESCKETLNFTKARSQVLEGTPPPLPSLEMTPRLWVQEHFAKWHAALSCWFLFFICIVELRCRCYSRKTSQVRQQYFNISTDLWMVCHWAEKDPAWTSESHYNSIWIDAGLKGPHFPTSQSAEHFQCLRQPAD